MAGFEMSRIDLRGRALTAAQLRATLPRGGVDVDAVLPKVRPIVEAVAERGAAAALEFGESFDGIRPGAVRVPAAALARALAELDPAVRAALEVAIERTRAVHAEQRRTDITTADPSSARSAGLPARAGRTRTPGCRASFVVPTSVT